MRHFDPFYHAWAKRIAESDPVDAAKFILAEGATPEETARKRDLDQRFLVAMFMSFDREFLLDLKKKSSRTREANDLKWISPKDW